MTPLPITDIRRCAADADFVAAMHDLYARLDAEIAGHAPVCTNRGACCKFDAFGHRLYVTSIELAYFLARSEGPLLAPPDRSFCPYQQGGKCHARSARPAACRVFFCDAAAQEWQPGTSEESLKKLAGIGDRFGLPYVYLEWTEALRMMGGALVDRPPVARVGLSIDIAARSP